MARGGRGREDGGGRRTCLGCRRVRDKRELTRLVLAPGGVVCDELQALPGRGAYVCRQEACAQRAAGRLSKALRSPGIAVSGDELWARARGEAR